MSAMMQSLDHDRVIVERRRYPRPEGTLGMRPVDRNFLRRFTLGNLELEREVLMLFVDQAPVYIISLNQADSQKSWHAAAHTLKGASRAIGAWRIARAAEAAEKLQYEPHSDRRMYAIDTAAEAVEEAVKFIEETYSTP